VRAAAAAAAALARVGRPALAARCAAVANATRDGLLAASGGWRDWGVHAFSEAVLAGLVRRA